MRWLDSQLKTRRQRDDERFQDAFSGIAGAILGKRLVSSFEKDRLARSAVNAILSYYKIERKAEPAEQPGLDEEEKLNAILRPYGIKHRQVRLDGGWYRHAIGPMLATLREDGSAVVLLPGRFSGYVILDPLTDERVRVNRHTAQLLDTDATCFYQPLPTKSLKMNDLLLFMKAQISLSDVLLLLFSAAAVTLIGLFAPFVTKWLLGPVIETNSIRVLAAVAIFTVCYSLARLLMSAFQALVQNRILTKNQVAVQAAVMNRILSLPPKFFKDYTAGELSRRAAYVQSLCSIVVQTIAGVGLNSLFSIVYIGQIFAFADALVLPAVMISLFTVLISVVSTLWRTRVMRKEMLFSAKESGISYSMISGIQKIKLAGAEKRMFARWADHYAKVASLAYNPPLFLKLGNTLTLAVSLIGTLVLYRCAIGSHVSVADYYAFNAAYGMVSAAFTEMIAIAANAANIRPTLEMARPILEAEPETAQDRETVTKITGAVEISNLTFRYEEDGPCVLDNLSLSINAGEYVAIVGKTGCGKSTLMRLLLGFEKPQKGAIYYDRYDISRVDPESLRRRIGAVMQNGRLFPGDIYSNIVISAPQLTLDDAWEAARLASVDDDIRAMPMGMHTIISEGQGGISGGQKQRLMIARAIAPRPKILMFDEATSALDNITQKKVAEAIDELHCTRIVIAHRLSTIRHCDRIILLDRGRIAEEGTYEELIEKNGLFAELVARQRLDE